MLQFERIFDTVESCIHIQAAGMNSNFAYKLVRFNSEYVFEPLTVDFSLDRL